MNYLKTMSQEIENNEAFVTSSSWNFKALEYYSDECLSLASGLSAELDFWKLHSYCHGECSSWSAGSPMISQKEDYTITKPLIMGEFSSSCSAGNSVSEMYEYFYENQYDGALGWQMLDEGEGHCSDGKTVTLNGVNHISDRTDNGVIFIDLQGKSRIFVSL